MVAPSPLPEMSPRLRLAALTCLKAEGPQQALNCIAVNRNSGSVRFSVNARFAAALSCVTLLPCLAQAQDIEAGREIATKWCSSCHDVSVSGEGTSDRTPSFLSISQKSSTTTISLAAFLQTSHNRMPDFSLTRQEIADVSSYILDLKRQRQLPAH
jgi:mono/diheme cytochrome c family protein